MTEVMNVQTVSSVDIISQCTGIITRACSLCRSRVVRWSVWVLAPALCWMSGDLRWWGGRQYCSVCLATWRISTAASSTTVVQCNDTTKMQDPPKLNLIIYFWSTLLDWVSDVLPCLQLMFAVMLKVLLFQIEIRRFMWIICWLLLPLDKIGLLRRDRLSLVIPTSINITGNQLILIQQWAEATTIFSILLCNFKSLKSPPVKMRSFDGENMRSFLKKPGPVWGYQVK